MSYSSISYRIPAPGTRYQPCRLVERWRCRQRTPLVFVEQLQYSRFEGGLGVGRGCPDEAEPPRRCRTDAIAAAGRLRQCARAVLRGASILLEKNGPGMGL